jgi:hypothetical protein
VSKQGIAAENTIMMSFDDVAGASENPFKGQLFNKPDPTGMGDDVYKGCKIDYSGTQVTPTIFLGVLTGKGDGKVLRSTAEDNVFVFFVDHGAPGLIAFPSQELHKAQLQAALAQMSQAKMFKKLADLCRPYPPAMTEFHELSDDAVTLTQSRKSFALRCVSCIGVCALLLAAVACLVPPSHPGAPEDMPALRGGDRDAHGCIPSAGYRWCDTMTSCIRPFEHDLQTEAAFSAKCGKPLATFTCNCPPTEVLYSCTREQYQAIKDGTTCPFYKRKEAGVVDTRDGVEGSAIKEKVPKASGNVTKLLGGDRDAHDCIPSAGYKWCEAMTSCIRPFEHDLQTEAAFSAKCEKPLETFTCNCPPTEVLYSCTREQYQAIMDGTTCPFYKDKRVGADDTVGGLGKFPTETKTQVASGNVLNLLGGDRDAHGCIPSAGYRWCDTMTSCIRPFEHDLQTEAAFSAKCGKPLATFTCNCPPTEVLYSCTREQYQAIKDGTTCPFYKRKEAGVVDTRDGAEASAIKENVPTVSGDVPRLLGGDKDAHGCIPSAGYTWCEAMTSCIRPFEHDLQTEAAFSAKCGKSMEAFTCHCPPTEVLYSCTREQYQAIKDGTTCPFYQRKAENAKNTLVAKKLT